VADQDEAHAGVDGRRRRAVFGLDINHFILEPVPVSGQLKPLEVYYHSLKVATH
jgi:hypothetical protein